jgi:mRNA interferase HigB
MWVITEKRLREFAEKHPKAKRPLLVWAELVKAAQWRNASEVKKTFNDVDFLSASRAISNAAGYRISTDIKYVNAKSRIGRVYIRHLLTHDEYDKRTRAGTL